MCVCVCVCACVCARARECVHVCVSACFVCAFFVVVFAVRGFSNFHAKCIRSDIKSCEKTSTLNFLASPKMR